ncbi:SAV_915 family protein [Streptomyces sp. NRRL S-350]|uniref:SAV_915 family protein n=1 Tax=Streptomyces sp. NRRL S-350 TaxID=1463902 RepID=UPI00068AB723|nr:SAV_915 family protein [Streptomyces sp. NRRL S-350]
MARIRTARVVWHVPVTISGTGSTTALRLFRLRDGRRCAVGFSSPGALAALLGPDQASAEFGEPALRALVAPLGVDTLVLDPRLVAPPAAPPAAAPPAAAPAGLPAVPAVASAPAAPHPPTPTAQLQRR